MRPQWFNDERLTKMQVQAHSELMWILSCTASMGYLSRMTQWKVSCPAMGKGEVRT